jgi:orotate phosphoribosyltransferase
VQEVEALYGITVINIVGLGEVINHVSQHQQGAELVAKVQAYRSAYGI